MPILPTRTQDLLDWFDQHRPVWIANAAGIGLTPAQANSFNTLSQQARAAWNDKIAAEEAARIAANESRESIRDARRSASDLIRIIKAFAEASNKPSTIYDLAQIPQPTEPTPLPAPGRPFELSVSLVNPTGALELRWKVLNPAGSQGTSYIVRRKLPSESAFSFVGVTGEKRFVDNTFIAGPDTVEFTVQGQRADSAGPLSQVLLVRFGRSGPGITIVSTSSAKLAA